jgi:hypothetical protein
MANEEFHRDLAVQRLTHGLEEAKKRGKRKTQKGSSKVNGRKTYLEPLSPSPRQMKKLKKEAKGYKAGKIGCRTLAKLMTKILKLKDGKGNDKGMCHETAKRLSKQVLQST